MASPRRIVIRTLNGSSHQIDLPHSSPDLMTILDMRRAPGLHPDLRSCQFFFKGSWLTDDQLIPDPMPAGSFLVAMPGGGHQGAGSSKTSARRPSRQVKALQRKEAQQASGSATVAGGSSAPASPAAKRWSPTLPHGGGLPQGMDSLLVGYSLRPSPIKNAPRNKV